MPTLLARIVMLLLFLAASRAGAVPTSVTIAGSLQNELGCATDWDAACLRSWLQDPDGDGTLGFTAWLPGGEYEAIVAHGESWSESYGAGGVLGGANIPFAVPAPGRTMALAYDPGTHLLEITVPEPSRSTLLAAVLAVVAVRGARGLTARDR